MNTIRSMTMLLLLTPFIGICTHADDSNAKPAIPFGELRKQSIDRAHQSQVTLQSTFEKVINVLNKNSTTRDDEHDGLIIESLTSSQEAWSHYRDAHCEAQALLYVYPSGSGLYVQEQQFCLFKLNNERIDYLEDILKGYEQ